MAGNLDIEGIEPMLISSSQVADLINRCGDPANIQLCTREIEQMISIKDVLLWRADAAASCIGGCLSMCLDREVQTLNNALDAIKQGNIPSTISILQEYQKLIY